MKNHSSNILHNFKIKKHNLAKIIAPLLPNSLWSKTFTFLRGLKCNEYMIIVVTALDYLEFQWMINYNGYKIIQVELLNVSEGSRIRSYTGLDCGLYRAGSDVCNSRQHGTSSRNRVLKICRFSLVTALGK